MPEETTVVSSQNPFKNTNKNEVSKIIIQKPVHLKANCLMTVQYEIPWSEKSTEKATASSTTKDLFTIDSTYGVHSKISLLKLRKKTLVPEKTEGILNNIPISLGSGKTTTDRKSIMNSHSYKSEETETELLLVKNYAEAVGPSQCQKCQFNIPYSELVFDNLEKHEDEPEPSHALKHWELWMKRRINLQTFLCKTFERKPCDLIMNQADVQRKVLEGKAFITCVQDPKFSKAEGDVIRAGSKKRGESKKSSSKNLRESSKTSKTNKNICTIPKMGFIGIPYEIEKEKGLTCLEEVKALSYKKEDAKELEANKRNVGENLVKMHDLAVIGQNIFSKRREEKVLKAKSNAPEIFVNLTDTEETKIVENRPCGARSVFCLVINGKIIKYESGNNYYGSKSDEDIDKNFELKIEFEPHQTGILVEKSLVIENRGTMAVAYEWVPDHVKLPELKSMDTVKKEPWFFFNKNSGCCLPGQIYYLKVYHFTKKPGVRSETWYLKTNPPLSEGVESCKVILTSMAVDEKATTEIRCLKSYIKGSLGDTIVKDILNRLLYDVTQIPLRQIEYRCLFLEKILFEYHNPRHYYNFTIVRECNELFQEISLDPDLEWDLSLNTLLNLALTCTPRKTQNILLGRISEKATKLLRPQYYGESHQEKSYKMAYGVLCKVINFMDDYFRDLTSNLWQNKLQPNDIILFESERLKPPLKMKSYKYNALGTLFQNPIDTLYFQTMFYYKVYHWLCEAAECIAGIIETKKFLEPWKKSYV